MNHHQVNRRFMVVWLMPLCLVMTLSDVVVAQRSMNWATIAAFVKSRRGFRVEPPRLLRLLSRGWLAGCSVGFPCHYWSGRGDSGY